MVNLIRSEWIKFRSVRSTLITLFLAGAFVVLIAVIAAVQASDDGVTHLTDLTAGVSVAALIFGALGVQVLGQEYRFNTIRPTFTAMPRRWRVLAAKLIVVTTACAAISVVMVAFCWVVGAALVGNFEVDGVDQRAMLGIVLFSIGWSALGMGVGAIVRQPVAGILILLAEAFVVESLLSGLVESSSKFLPFLNGFQMTFRASEGGDDQLRSVLGGGIYFFLVVAVVWAIGAYLANHRDA
ncbi:ABC transporter permease [Aquihabitans sp. G128]|uniref:ABC transporter permease n=1 Tax=Aquihabitans sp. G128 TaxID=2849779 RepID=UPI001C2255BE|nr:ABC transporter permease [Aquihabitans sp. G128]QXC60814.1 ABC transporter permease [Aquihabitans sp. G128]